MENSSDKLSFEEIIAKHFPEVGFERKDVDLGGNMPVFFLRFEDAAALQAQWRQIANAIAIYFQAKMNDEFGRWNTYLFYIVEDEIPKDLEYQIENDVFSSRKIVVKEKMDDKAIIQMHIINKDLEITGEGSVLGFDYNQQIWNALNGQPVRKKKNIPQVADDALLRFINVIQTPKS